MEDKDKERNTIMFERYQNGESPNKLAKEYGISKQRVYEIVKREADRKDVRLRNRNYPSIKTVEMKQDILEKWENGYINTRELARLHDVGYDVMRRTLKQRNMKQVVLPKSRKSIDVSKDLYDKFMKGISVKELSKEYKINEISIRMRTHYYRVRFGLKGKYPNYKRK